MTLILPRRQFLFGLTGIFAAPAIIKASSLMRIIAVPEIIMSELYIITPPWRKTGLSHKRVVELLTRSNVII